MNKLLAIIILTIVIFTGCSSNKDSSSKTESIPITSKETSVLHTVKQTLINEMKLMDYSNFYNVVSNEKYIFDINNTILFFENTCHVNTGISQIYIEDDKAKRELLLEIDECINSLNWKDKNTLCLEVHIHGANDMVLPNYKYIYFDIESGKLTYEEEQISKIIWSNGYKIGVEQSSKAEFPEQVDIFDITNDKNLLAQKVYPYVITEQNLFYSDEKFDIFQYNFVTKQKKKIDIGNEFLFTKAQENKIIELYSDHITVFDIETAEEIVFEILDRISDYIQISNEKIYYLATNNVIKCVCECAKIGVPLVKDTSDSLIQAFKVTKNAIYYRVLSMESNGVSSGNVLKETVIF